MVGFISCWRKNGFDIKITFDPKKKAGDLRPIFFVPHDGPKYVKKERKLKN